MVFTWLLTVLFLFPDVMQNLLMVWLIYAMAVADGIATVLIKVFYFESWGVEQESIADM